MKKIKHTFYNINTEKAQNTEKRTGDELVLFCLSDLHGNEYGQQNRVIVEAAWDQKPDLILAAGDMLSGEKGESDAVAVALLSRLVDLAPVCFTDGNHEMQVKKFCPERYKAFMEGLEKGGVQVLHNETWCTETGGQKVAVTGYELPWEYYRRFNRKHPSAEEIVKSIGTRQEDAYQILLTHNPVFFEEYARWGADFAFAGHLHGGFIRLPFLGGVISPQFQVFPKYDRGLYQRGESHLVAGAGMGDHSWMFRINNPPEMITVRIKR